MHFTKTATATPTGTGASWASAYGRGKSNTADGFSLGIFVSDKSAASTPQAEINSIGYDDRVGFRMRRCSCF